ncbi:hypothetical protein OC846_002703, partial [Tilletia horrida]
HYILGFIIVTAADFLRRIKLNTTMSSTDINSEEDFEVSSAAKAMTHRQHQHTPDVWIGVDEDTARH